MKELDSSSWPIILMMSVMLGMVPVIPFALVSGILGIKYGVWGGSGMSVIASSLAAILTYWIFGKGGDGSRKRSSINRLNTWNDRIRNRAFLFVLIGRMLPFIPAAFINGYAGLFKIPFVPFLTATVIGKIPMMLVFAYVGVSTSSGSLYWVPVLLIYGGFLSGVYMLYTRLFPYAKPLESLEKRK
ncbi:VTT domain-containing protein [Paenibacillus kribbensis]|uniref:TVP38/TMEM64 family protein n=1 Tax=Paenibacillus kribbensis TaxID=172713 RepID=UPI002DBDCC6C|nr:VTT domain-containing protein [Paenibacillus kribbensis]MEC0236640.1 VTT domain-containing protein [Paenibacillus kribbensis]